MNYAVFHELQNAITFDRAFHVVSDADSVYFGSSSDDTTYALEGKPLWTHQVDGNVEGLALSHGRLLASLDNGTIVCFQQGGTVGAPRSASASGDPYSPNPILRAAAETAVTAATTKQGYCLVLQSGTGQLAYEIAKISDFQIICREQDPAKISASRAALRKAGLYGRRVVVHQGDAEDLPYPKYFANLIVCESSLAGSKPLPPAESVLRMLRPCGGVVSIAIPPGAEITKLKEWGKTLPGWTVSESGLRYGIARRGVLPGSGEWSHFYANPANTACSNDELRPGEMNLQWFGRPGPQEMVDRHKKGPAPLYKNGRLFVAGFNYFAAVDAYNGCVLWERNIADSARVAAFKDCSNMVATDEHLLIASGRTCLMLDAQTGQTRRELSLAAGAEDDVWGYLAIAGNTLVGSAAKATGSLRAMGKPEDLIIWRNKQPVVCSTSVFAVDRDSGQSRWSYAARKGLIINPTLTIGDGRLFFVESSNAVTLQSKDGRATLAELLGSGSQLVSIDLDSGRVLFSQPVDLASLQHIIYMSYANNTLLITGSKYATVDPAETRGRPKPTQLTRVRYDLFAFDAATETQRWKTTQIPNYDEVLDGGHGEQVQHPAIVGDVVYGPDFAVRLTTGEAYKGWKWRKSAKCATLATSRYCAFSRFSNAKLPYLFDLKSGNPEPLMVATRPGCWINTLPAGGMILIPEASAGCTCPYPMQASVSLIPAD